MTMSLRFVEGGKNSLGKKPSCHLFDYRELAHCEVHILCAACQCATPPPPSQPLAPRSAVLAAILNLGLFGLLPLPVCHLHLHVHALLYLSACPTLPIVLCIALVSRIVCALCPAPVMYILQPGFGPCHPLLDVILLPCCP